MLIFHIALESDWTAARPTGEYRISTLGASLAEVGFIHASFPDQVELIAKLAYDKVTEPLVLLVINDKALPAPVRVEPVPALGLSFPHIYGPIPAAAVTNVQPLTRGQGPGDHWTWPQAEDWRHPVPDRIPIAYLPSSRTGLIGQYRDGLFVAGFCRCTYLHLFDHDGAHVSSLIGPAEQALGPDADVEALVTHLEAQVDALPGREFGDVAIRPFCVDLGDGHNDDAGGFRYWGLLDETEASGFPHAELEPDMLGFSPPWDGLYST